MNTLPFTPRGYLFLLIIITAALFSGCAGGPDSAGQAPESRGLSSWDGSRNVATLYGRVRSMPVGNNVLFWRAIPYAAPPVEELRWKAPRDPEPWTGLLYKKTAQPRAPQFGFFPKRSVSGDEDCLYLNVWRPDSPETGLPVTVWIHGGGNTTGSTMELPDYSGTMPAHRQNIVYVGINYRLGPFGWFLQDSFANEPGSTALDRSGNFGLLDIMKALEWVKENIAAFGGDPDNVTVAGESAGGIDILALLMSPLTEGLFDKAQIRSGGIMLSEPEEGFRRGDEVLRSLLSGEGLSEQEITAWINEKPPGETAKYLRSQPAERILKLYEPKHFGMITMPLLFKDGTVLPEEGQEVFSTGDYPSKVPVMIGSNADEVRLFLAFSDRFGGYGDFYRAATEYGSNIWKVNGVDSIARALSGNPGQPPVYVYQFRWGTMHEDGWSVLPCKNGARFGSCHALEVPFFAGTAEEGSLLFDAVFFTRANKPGRLLLQDAVISYSAEFSRTGKPGRGINGGTGDAGGPELPEWRAWSNTGEDKCMVLDAGFEELILGMSPLEMTRDKARAILRGKTSPEQYEEILEIMDDEGPNLKILGKIYEE